MSVDPMDRAAAAGHAWEMEWLDRSIGGLRQAAPDMSAQRVLSRRQQIWVAVVVVLIIGAGFADLFLTLQIMVAGATLLYACTLVYRLILVRRGLAGSHLIQVSDADALAVPTSDLPTYSVLVPAYKEPAVIAKIIDAVSGLNYPADKLDVRLLLEADDQDTITTARARVAAIASPRITIVLVPPVEPRTKPKACNFGLQSASGDRVTIFDAEDRPEPLQLRRAVVALDRLGDGYACVQARLGYFNSTQNWITRWFTLEYGTWFRFLLPGLVSVGAPIPLGGTSNHFRTGLLRALLAWDPYNVTEDADLGIRLARLGYSVGVLDSTTEEEANSDFVNWVKQRSRWYKGYLQTWLVHMRRPVAVHRELGWRGALGLHLFVLGTPLTTLMNPIFWALAIVWYLQEPNGVALLFPPTVYYLALACFVIGNAAVIYVNALIARVMNRPALLGAALLVPVYWVMMSVAAVKAAYQLVFQPSYWEKTAHGLNEKTSHDLNTEPSPDLAEVTA
jgi:cellulose synthase/poly-beta-1,6-N-acetylglucosamine synthase-like glycosyltransferase